MQRCNLIVGWLLAAAIGANAAERADQYDLVVVGGTPGGIACAVRGAREGLSVLLVERTGHLGGMLTNGLCQWDALYDGMRSPIFAETVRDIENHYRDKYGADSPQFREAEFTQKHYPLGKFESSVAEKTLTDLVTAEKNISVLKGFIPSAVDREGTFIRSITLKAYRGDDVRTVEGKTFVDATYEADLAYLAKVPYRAGREARSEFNEPHAGKLFCNIEQKPSPTDVVEGRLNLRVYGQRQGTVDPSSPFTADNAIQAFNYRFCISNQPNNIRILTAPPPGYNREEYVKYERKFMGGIGAQGKATMNSPILPGENHGYPDGDWPTREKIIERHLNFALGLMYFLQNDESISEAKRREYRKIGLPLDEYVDHNNIPYEMYVRETRRIVGRHVFNEIDNMPAPGLGRTPIFPDSIAITDWYMDSHSCTLESRPGYKYEGKLILTEESRPAQIPYRSLLAKEIDNLLVPVCLSCTHVAYGAVRLEPVWMQTGESAGFAAALSAKAGTTPGKLDPDLLVRTLIAKNCMVSFFNDEAMKSEQPWRPAVQYLGTKGFFGSYDAQPEKPLGAATAKAWAAGYSALTANRLPDATEIAKTLPTGEDSAITVGEFVTMLKERGSNDRADRAVDRLGLAHSAPLTRGSGSQIVYDLLNAAP